MTLESLLPVCGAVDRLRQVKLTVYQFQFYRVVVIVEIRKNRRWSGEGESVHCSLLPPGLPSGTFAHAVSSELIGFCF